MPHSASRRPAPRVARRRAALALCTGGALGLAQSALAADPSPLAPTPRALALDVSGSVHSSSPTGDWRPLSSAEPIGAGAVVTAGPNGAAAMLLESFRLSLGAGSTLSLPGTPSDVDVALLRGLLRTEDLLGPSRLLRIATPVARITQRGGTIDWQLTASPPGEALLLCNVGTAETTLTSGSLAHAGDSGASGTTLGAGSCLRVDAEGGVQRLEAARAQIRPPSWSALRDVSPLRGPGPAARRFESADVSAARFGDPADVAAGAGFSPLGFAARPAIGSSDRSRQLLQPCDLPSSGCVSGRAAIAAQPAPVNPWIPGVPPPPPKPPPGNPRLPGTPPPPGAAPPAP